MHRVTNVGVDTA